MEGIKDTQGPTCLLQKSLPLCGRSEGFGKRGMLPGEEGPLKGRTGLFPSLHQAKPSFAPPIPEVLLYSCTEYFVLFRSGPWVILRLSLVASAGHLCFLPLLKWRHVH